MFKIIKTSQALAAEFRDKLIIENSKRFVLLLVFVAFSQVVFALLELFHVLKWDNAIFIARIAVFGACSIFASLIYILGKIEASKKTILAQGILTSAIQLISISAGCYFVVFMFNAGIFSYSAFLLVSFVVSITCVRTPYYSGFIILLFFTGLTIFLSTYNVHQLSSWIGEFSIALVFIFLIDIGNVLTYNRHIKLFLQDKEILKINSNLKSISQTDELTRIFNRRKIAQVLDEYLALSKRYQTCFCIVLIDIDHFKKVNDQFGHNAGDCVLCQFSTHIQSMLRSTDIFGRWGGEEFLLLLPNCQEPDALILVERLRKSIEKFNFPEAGHITFSAGIRSYRSGDTFSKLTEEVDIALYQAKKAGRNQTAIYRQNEQDGRVFI